MAVGAPVTTQLKPYVFFYGKCEQALKFYQDVFGGSFEITRVKDSPMAKDGSAGGDRVMHASFTAPGISFLASDGRDDKVVDPEDGNVSLALDIDEPDAAKRIFAALSEGGNVTMPLESAFWGGKFGAIQDRFGTEWLVTTK